MTEAFKRGDWVLYIPGHANGSVEHPDCERGTVYRIVPDIKGDLVFVTYNGELHPKATNAADLISADEYFAALLNAAGRRSERQPPPNGHGYRTYLGDGLFADFDGTNIVLSAENGVCAHDVVFIELGVHESFKRWHAARIAPLFSEG